MSESNRYGLLFRNLTFLQWASIVLLLLAGIIGVILLIVGGPLSKLSIAGFVLTTTLAVITDRINRHRFENETTITLEKEMKDPCNLNYLGSRSHGTDWLRRNCVGATLSYNTAFNRSDDVDLNPDELNEYCACIRRSIKGGSMWHDFFKAGDEPMVDQFFLSLNDEQKPKYSAIRVSSNIPLLQFLIMHYSEHRTAVLFGWGFKGCTRPAVWCSENQRTTDYFVNYAKQLAQSGELYITRGERKAALGTVGGPAPAS